MMAAILKHIDFEVPSYGEFAAGPQLKRGWVSAVSNLSPQRWWRLGETAGIVATDQQGLDDGAYLPNSGGAWTGGTLGQTGPLAFTTVKAALFNGTSGYVEAAGYAGITGSNARSVIAWVKLTGTPTTDGLVEWGTATAGGAWRLSLDIPTQAVRTEVGSGYKVGATALDDGEWHLLGHTFNGTNVTDTILYVDGQVESLGSQSSRTVNTASGTHVHIGQKNHTSFLPATIAEVMIFNFALTSTNMTDLYNAGVGQ